MPFYAVKFGRTPGIYPTWEECRKQVDGFSGAVFKKFLTEEEAKDFISPSDANFTETPNLKPSNGSITAYVDGSYDSSSGDFSYGMVIIQNNKEQSFYKCFSYSLNSQFALMRNVAGEIEGAAAAMKYCIDHSIAELYLYFDYEGIEKWCTGEWKTNKPGTIAYKKYYDSIKDHVKIHFCKVKGHSGDKYNERADKLAKYALGLEAKKRVGQ